LAVGAEALGVEALGVGDTALPAGAVTVVARDAAAMALVVEVEAV